MSAKYLIISTLICLAIFSGIATLNYAVDPLNYFRANYPTYFSSERELKARLIEEKSWDGIILGSSKATHIQPSDIKSDQKVLNAAFSAAKPEEIVRLILDKKPKVKWIALGIDWYMFNEKSFSYDNNTYRTFDHTAAEKTTYLTSYKTTYYSVMSILRKIRQEAPLYTKNGANNSRHRETDDMKSGQYYYKTTLTTLRQYHYNEYHISQKRIKDLEKLEKWAHSHNIKLVVWINPFNREVYNLMSGLLDTESMRLPDILKKKFDTVIDLSKSYPDKSGYWKKDPYHYYPSLADKFFNQNILPHLKQ